MALVPVTRVGPYCERCGERPIWLDGLCSACSRLLKLTGETWRQPAPDYVPEWLDAE